MLRLDGYVSGSYHFLVGFGHMRVSPMRFLCWFSMGGSLSLSCELFLDRLNSCMGFYCSGEISLSMLDALLPLSPVSLTLGCFFVGDPSLLLCSASGSCVLILSMTDGTL